MAVEYQFRAGGLMRCCLKTLDDHMLAAEAEPNEGDKLPCSYCSALNGGMIFRDGAWEWNRPEGVR